MTAITSERLPNSLISLEIEVEPERVEKSIERAVRKISQQVKIKGFRPGKAPRRAVVASVGEEQMFATAIDELLPLVVEEAVKEEGIDIVGPAEEAVITRFGSYRVTVGPGINWLPRFVDSVYIVDIQNVSDYSYSSSMLTKDENIVSVELAVQYRIDNPKDYLFNVDSPLESL